MKIIEGRASRGDYFKVFSLFILAGLFIAFGLPLIDNLPKLLITFIQISFAILGNYFYITTGIKRLHDFNKSGWWYLYAIIPIANFVLLLALLFKPGTIGENQYGQETQ